MDLYIAQCETIEELNFLEAHYILSEDERALVFKRRVDIVGCLLWSKENERHGLPANLTDSPTATIIYG